MSVNRRRFRRSLLFVSALAALAVLSAPVSAFAAAPTYSQWRVSLWPEYDDPRTLVIYEPQVDPSVALPFKFSYNAFPLDAQVGMTCQVTPSGSHECQQRQTSVVGDLESISYTAPSQRQLYMEYYTDMLGGQKPSQRKMTYTFVAPADIADLQVSIRQPKDATGFTVTPKPVAQQTDGDGFTTASYGFQNVKAGQKYTFTFSYTRPTWTPPVAKTQNGTGQTSGALASGTGTQAGAGNAGTYGLVAAAALLGAFAAIILRRKPSAPSAAGATTSTRKSAGTSGGTAAAKKTASASSRKRTNGGTSRSAKPRPEA